MRRYSIISRVPAKVRSTFGVGLFYTAVQETRLALKRRTPEDRLFHPSADGPEELRVQDLPDRAVAGGR